MYTDARQFNLMLHIGCAAHQQHAHANRNRRQNLSLHMVTQELYYRSKESAVQQATA